LLRKRTLETPEGYSFVPFLENRCIFVHVPKAAGISVAASLFGNLGGGHTSLGIYQLVFTKQEYDSFFKFTFVRNPWDRIFSAFHFLKKGGFNQYDRRWATEHLADYSTFDEFVKKWVTRKNVLKYVHFVPQFRFVCLPEQAGPGVDFLGYFENLNEDFRYVQNRLNKDRGQALPHKNRTSSDRKLDFREHYNETTRSIVADVYETDIRMFGYDFDNSALQSVLRSRNP